MPDLDELYDRLEHSANAVAARFDLIHVSTHVAVSAKDHVAHVRALTATHRSLPLITDLIEAQSALISAQHSLLEALVEAHA